MFVTSTKAAGLAAMTLLALSMSVIPLENGEAHAAQIPGGQAQVDGFTPIGIWGAYRIDGVRRGLHKDVPVRFLDISLRNTSNDGAFADTLHDVRWQGRQSGDDVPPLRRDGAPFGMFDQIIAIGETRAITYAIPDREDVEGVSVEYQPEAGMPDRVWTWEELEAAAAQASPTT